jgi:hypothetical protein
MKPPPCSVKKSVRFRHLSHGPPDNRQEKATLIQQPQPVFMNLARHDCCATEAANLLTISNKKQSEVNMKTKLAAVCLSLILPAQAQLALAQSSQLSSNQAWDLVKETTLGEKLEVKLKDGRKVKGDKVLVSDSELTLTLKNQQAAQFKRDEIRQVWRSLPPDPDKQRLYGTVGFGVGLVGGIALAAAVSRQNDPCYDCRGRGVGMVAAVIGVTTAGALIGRKLGGGGKRMLIYQAP